MNLRDVLSLRYDDYYFSHGRKQMRFTRHKVADRTAATVVFPILPELRIILDRQANKETRNGLVFNTLSKCFGNDAEERRQTQLLNHVVRDRMRQVCYALNIGVDVTGTWARHSFATNLIQGNVPRDYIVQSMAHSAGDTTDNYIDTYSYEQMYEYNSKLLHKDSKPSLLASLQALSGDELKALLAMVGK
jgi:integrase